MGELNIFKGQSLPSFLLLLTVVFLLGCNRINNFSNDENNCIDYIESTFLNIIDSGEGKVDLESFDCFEWDTLAIVEPFFNTKELLEITTDNLPPKMKNDQTNEEIFHLLFIDSNKKIKGHLSFSGHKLSLSDLVVGNKCYKTINKSEYNLQIYTSDQKMYKSDMFLIKCKLIKKQ
jgi:hypothetical protein